MTDTRKLPFAMRQIPRHEILLREEIGHRFPASALGLPLKQLAQLIGKEDIRLYIRGISKHRNHRSQTRNVA